MFQTLTHLCEGDPNVCATLSRVFSSSSRESQFTPHPPSFFPPLHFEEQCVSRNSVKLERLRAREEGTISTMSATAAARGERRGKTRENFGPQGTIHRSFGAIPRTSSGKW